MRTSPAISLAAVALLTAAASVAQPQTLDPTTLPPAATTTTGDPAATGTATTGPEAATGTDRDAATAATGSATLQGGDAEFLRQAIEGGREEVDNAQEAMQSAQRAEVRTVASTMLEEHQRANQQLEVLAQRNGWTLPAADSMAERDQSRSDMASGSDFDAAYITNEIRHHREAIALYRKQAASGSDPELQRFASDSLPKLEHHLEMLEAAHTQK